MFIHFLFIYSVRIKLSRVFLWYLLDQLLLCCFLFVYFCFCKCRYAITSDLTELSNFNSLEVKSRRKTNCIRRDNRKVCKRKSICPGEQKLWGRMLLYQEDKRKKSVSEKSLLASRTYEAGCSDIKKISKIFDKWKIISGKQKLWGRMPWHQKDKWQNRHVIFNACWFYYKRFH